MCLECVEIFCNITHESFNSMEKKTVLITGASGNLGKVTVGKFSTAGYAVIATISPGRTLGYQPAPNVDVVEIDLATEASVDKVMPAIFRKYGAIDAALFLAGGFAMGSVADTDAAALDKMFSINFNTAYYPARRIFQQMAKQPAGGRMIFIGSRPALQPAAGKNAVGYALSKSLIFSLADLLNADGASKNVTSSVIVPSTIDTPANRESMPTADFTAWVKPEEIADAMMFIVSDGGKSLRETVLKIYGRS